MQCFKLFGVCFCFCFSLSLSFSLCLSLVSFSCAQNAEELRPNILIILADDMGISDAGCYGGEISTPNIDSLAAEGVRMRCFYNTARCCPTRASLLTGLYPHQAGIGHMMDDRGVPGYRGELAPNCVTIAEVLRSAGYKTYMVGKWHVTRNTTDEEHHTENWPLQRGFDEFYGTLSGAGNYFEPASLVRGNHFISSEADPDYRPSNGVYYFTNACGENAIKYLKKHEETADSAPFFMYLAFTSPHWPMQALPEDIARYKGKFDAGWDVLRAERLERMKRLGIVPPSTELSPRDPEVPAWDSLSEEEKAWCASRMEVYAAMIECMDRNIGQVVAQLKASGKWENTLVFFLQDNGACAETMGLGNGKKVLYARGKAASASDRNPAIRPETPITVRSDVWLRDGRPVRSGFVTPGPADTYLAYGRCWANLSDTPFRMYKHWVHEGGISSPLIVSWPAHLEHCDWVDGPGHLMDLMATCVDVSGAEYPKKRASEDVQPMEGVSLIPVLNGQKLQRESPLFFEHEKNRAVRMGEWKLVAKANQPWELYRIGLDRAETTNLAEKYPEKVEMMAAEWEKWAIRTHVVPRK